jgi:N-acetylmuramic acid 6-phosphate etherase
VADALAAGGRLIYVGAGTSGRLGALDAAECPPTFGISPTRVLAVIAGGPRALRRAVEGAEDDVIAGGRAMAAERVGRDDVVIGISASGTTPFVRAALREGARRRARVALLTCNRAAARAGSPLKLDHLVVLDTGPELVAGSTRLKGGTATKMALNLISTAAMVRLGRVYRGRMVSLRPTNEKLRRRARRMVEELARVDGTAAARALRSAGGDVGRALVSLGVRRPAPRRFGKKGALRG